MGFSVLAFFAHPDDETMLCGGTLALLAQQGAEVNILISTRGEGGEMGDPPFCEREALGQVREEELTCAVKALGAASLEIFDYIDPTIGEGDTLFAFSDNLEEVAARVAEVVRRKQADALLAHGPDGEYGHPAHKLVYQAARRAVELLGDDAPLFYTVQANFPGHPHKRLANESVPAHMVLDVTPVIGLKTQAALCHRTQHDLFVRWLSKETGRRVQVEEVIQPLESLHRIWPAFDGDGQIQDGLADLLWASGCARLPDPGSDLPPATG